VSLPLAGVRVAEYAQYVAGPLAGVLLSDLGAEVIKVEPPAGDGYRKVMPVAPGLGRFFLPLNRGKRSVVIDLRAEEGRRASAALLSSADVVLHNYPPARATEFQLGWKTLHESHPHLVAGVVSSFGRTGPLAGAPAYDLVAQARAGLLTAHASPGDRVPVRAGGIPMADLTAGMLLASGVLAALVRARETGVGELVEISLHGAALAVQLQDLVRLPAEAAADEARIAVSADLDRRAEEIARDTSMNPYYRCYAAMDGYVAVACLNVVQRRALLELLGLEDATVDAPDHVPDDPAVLAAKQSVTAEVERRIAGGEAADWIARLAAVGVPCGPVHVQATALEDGQARANHLSATIDQPGIGQVSLLGPVLRVGADEPGDPLLRGAPELGADTAAVLGELGIA
jgi:crotonobetainyl-CoA:carnitine CoA-transferase CaiB-like acyl-CoA transferase